MKPKVYRLDCFIFVSNQFRLAAFCRKFLEEDGANEEEIETELAIIKAQIAFCQQKLGKDDLALKVYNQILRQKYVQFCSYIVYKICLQLTDWLTRR